MGERGSKSRWFLIGLCTLSIALNIYFRLYTWILPGIDAAARREVLKETRDNLKEEEVDTYLSAHRKEIDRKIRLLSSEKKSFYLDERGWPYLLETDSYRWQRRIESYLDKGRFGSVRADHRQYDDLVFAPQGDRVEPLWLHYRLGAGVCKVMRLFNPKLSIANCLSLVPLLFVPIFVITVFWASSLLGMSHSGAFLASLYLGLAPIVAMRTTFGFFDTDTYNTFMPLLITCILACAFKGEQPGRRKTVSIILAGVLMGMYSGFWYTWWFFLCVILGGLLLYKTCVVVFGGLPGRKANIKEALRDSVLFIFVSYVFACIVTGSDNLIITPWNASALFYVRHALALDNFWPNAAFTIGEMQRPTAEVLQMFTGGNLVLFGGMAGLVVLVVYAKSLRALNEKNLVVAILLVWFIVTLVLTYFGERFILFLIVPLALAFSYLLDTLFSFIARNQKMNTALSRSLAGCMLLSFSLIPCYNAHRESEFAIMDDSWWSMLVAIRERTPADAIINTDWQRGESVMTVAHRATVQDAHLQYTPVAYWFARALLSRDEREAVNILRMIDHSRNQAFEELAKKLHGDKLAAMEVLDQALTLAGPEARELLRARITEAGEADRIARLIFTLPRPGFVMLPSGMLSGMKSLSRISSWDFKRYLAWHQLPPSINRREPWDWIAKESYEFRLPLAGSRLSPGSHGLLSFKNGLFVDTLNARAFFQDEQKKLVIAGRVIFISGDTVKEVRNQEGEQKYAVVLMKEKEDYSVLLFDAPLADTLFFKLYFLKGNGLKYFTQVAHEAKNRKDTDLYLYRIEWDRAQEE